MRCVCVCVSSCFFLPGLDVCVCACAAVCVEDVRDTAAASVTLPPPAALLAGSQRCVQLRQSWWPKGLLRATLFLLDYSHMSCFLLASSIRIFTCFFVRVLKWRSLRTICIPPPLLVPFEECLHLPSPSTARDTTRVLYLLFSVQKNTCNSNTLPSCLPSLS